MGLLVALGACGSDGKVTPLPEIGDGDLVTARRAAAAGREAEARAQWRELRRADPGHEEAWLGEARVLPDSERGAFLKELRTDAPNEDFATALATFLGPGARAARESALEQRLRDDETDFWARVFLGELYAEKGEDARARETLLPAFADDRFPLCSTRTFVAVSLAEAERAAALEGLLRLEAAGLDDYDTTYNVGTLLMEVNEDYDNAAERFAKARAMRPDELDPLLNQASATLLAGRDADGFRLLEEALDQHPESPDVHFNLGVYWSDHADDPARAIHHFERYLELGGEWKLRVNGWLRELRGEGGS